MEAAPVHWARRTVPGANLASTAVGCRVRVTTELHATCTKLPMAPDRCRIAFPMLDAALVKQMALRTRSAPPHRSLPGIQTSCGEGTRRRIRRGIFKSVAEPEDAIRRYTSNTITVKPSPSSGPKTPDQIFQKLTRLFAPSESGSSLASVARPAAPILSRR
jgi:hypothetical protein